MPSKSELPPSKEDVLLELLELPRLENNTLIDDESYAEIVAILSLL
jgi:hypothetical protein